MNAWVAVGVATAVVVALRVVFVVGNARLHAPAWFDRASAFVAPAVTAALVAPRVLGVPGRSVLHLGPDALAFALVVPVAVRTRSIGWTLAVGMPLVWAARAVL